MSIIPTTDTALTPEWDTARNLLAGIQQALRISIAGQVLLGQELNNLKKDLGFTHGGDRRSSGQPVHLIPRTWSDWVKSELGISYKTADRMILMADAAKARIKKISATGDLPGGRKKLELLITSRPSTMTDDDREKLAAVVHKITDGASQAELLAELKLVKWSDPPQIGGDTSEHRKPKTEEETLEQLSFIFLAPICEDLRKLCHMPELPTYLSHLPLDGEDDELSLTLLEMRTRELLTEIEATRKRRIAEMKRAK
jgi:hypothetical protein